MTARTPRPDDFDILLAAWLDADAHVREPDHLLASVLDRTSRSRPLPVWRLPERWLPMQLAMRTHSGPRLVPVLVILALLIVGLVAVGLIVGTRPRVPPPFGLAGNGQIAFIRDGSLVRANPDGSASLALGPDSMLQQAPSYSRDGTRLVYKDVVTRGQADQYAERVDIVVADADGSDARVVVHDVAAGSPIWSPDGRWLTYSAAGDHAWVVPADRSAPPTDIGFFGAGAWTPSWSPDSEHLAVAAGDGVLWLADRDGSGTRRLSTGAYAEVGEKGWSADWNPDGQHLLFGAGKPEQDYGLYLVGLDGAAERRISPCANNGVWSPDGTLFAYLRCGSGRGPSLVVADASGRTIRVLEGSYGWYMPAWSPDQTRIAILDDRPGPSNLAGPPVIAFVDPAGRAPTTTIPAGSVPLDPESGPDGTLTWQRIAP
jgi:dipeptidyl aminopeptidase/acylaminoacyl peptidase